MQNLEWSFNTITLPSWVHKKAVKDSRIRGSVSHYKKYWDRLMKRLKRAYGNFEYIRVIECHKSGVFHIHLLASIKHDDLHTGIGKNGKQFSYSPKFKENCVASKFGFSTNSQNIVDKEGNAANAGLVAAYITKYMTKESSEFAAAVDGMYVRRIQTSRKFGTPKDRKGSENWEITNGIREYDVYQAKHEGKEWLDKNTGEIIGYDHFEDCKLYPPPIE